MWVPSSKQARARARYHRLHLIQTGEAISPPMPLAVLIVDENIADVHSAARLFSVLCPYAPEVVHAPDLSHAIIELTTRRFDLIFCDFWLGQGSALGLVQAIQDRGLATPVTLLSSMETADLELISRRIGASGYMTKADLSAWTLERVVTSMLETGERQFQKVDAPVRANDHQLALSSRACPSSPAHQPTLPHNTLPSTSQPANVANIAFLPSHFQRFVHFDIIAAVQAVVDQWLDLSSTPDQVIFHAPRMAVSCWADPTSIHDVLRAFVAEGVEALKRGDELYLVPSLAAGQLRLELQGTHTQMALPAPNQRERSVRSERRLVVAALAVAAHGSFAESTQDDSTWHLILTIPLNQASQLLMGGTEKLAKLFGEHHA